MAILDAMAEVLPAPRPELAETAPKIEAVVIPRDRIGEVIGPKGKTIRELEAETGATIEIEDDGTVRIGSPDTASLNLAKQRIMAIGFPPEPELGKTYQGEVVNITKFGAFVNILPGRDGLLHISKIGGTRRIERVEDVLSLGDKVEVVVREIDDRGKVSLDMAGAEPGDGGGGDGGGGETEPRPRSERGDGDRSSRDRGNGGRQRDGGGNRRHRDRDRSERSEPSDRTQREEKPGRTVVSFEDDFEAGL